MRHGEIHKYNPRQTPPEELRATFVAREGMLATLVDELRGRATAPVNQHFLLIGPRGIGKTNLLLMIRYAVLGDEELVGAYLPLQTAEEEYSIASLRDLFSRILELLLEQVDEVTLSEVKASVDADGEGDHAAELAIAAVKDFSQRTGRKLLLLVDNLDLILDQQLTDDAQLGRLRDLLMNESFLVLFGAAPSNFREVTGYDRPFYNFFRTLDLVELTPEQMGELLRRHAELDGARTFLDRFDRLQPRIQAVHHLTGGNPRLVLMLYRLCLDSELPEIPAAVEAVLDGVTPYYKACLEALPPQQRRVLDTFARLGHPATPTELARETRLAVNKINSILKRLREAGLVAVAPQERRKSTLYMVSERVFRIWHQMRFTVAKRRLQFLVDFLRVWYAPVEVADPAGGQDKAALSRVQLLHRHFSAAAHAIENREYDRGRALFSEALDHASLAREDLVPREMAEFFSRVAGEETASLCAGLFEMMRQREMERELGLVAPIAHAVEFWQRGKDPEVLDRLNPEVREIVEEIIRQATLSGRKPSGNGLREARYGSSKSSRHTRSSSC